MGMMGGDHMSGWMIGLMVAWGLLSLVVVAAIVFVLVAAGRWLWHRTDPPSGTAGANR